MTANVQNLIPMNKRTMTERRKIAKMGGEASGKARRENADLRKIAQILLGEEYKEGLTNAQAMTLAQLQKALEGDTKAFEVLRDTAGQKPVQVVEDKISGGLQISWGTEEK